MNSRLPYAVLIFFIISALGLGYFLLKSSSGSCRETYKADKQIYVNGQKLDAQVASTNLERTQGLSGKKCIGKNQAMLFEFIKPGYYGFWMKDMRFNIDIVWLDPNHSVVYVQNNVSPSSYPASFVNQSPASAVMELKAGTVSRLNIETGTKVYY